MSIRSSFPLVRRHPFRRRLLLAAAAAGALLARSGAVHASPSDAGVARGEVRAAPRAAVGSTFFAIFTPDAATTARWYETHLDLREVRRQRPPDAPGVELRILSGTLATVEIVQRPGLGPHPEAAAGLMKVGVFVPSLAAWVDRWRAAGVGIVARFRDETLGADTAVVRAPDGVLLHVVERP